MGIFIKASIQRVDFLKCEQILFVFCVSFYVLLMMNVYGINNYFSLLESEPSMKYYRSIRLSQYLYEGRMWRYVDLYDDDDDGYNRIRRTNQWRSRIFSVPLKKMYFKYFFSFIIISYTFDFSYTIYV